MLMMLGPCPPVRANKHEFPTQTRELLVWVENGGGEGGLMLMMLGPCPCHSSATRNPSLQPIPCPLTGRVV